MVFAFVFQLLAVITVPITSLALCNYEGYRFGVFGLCDDSGCSLEQIGYRPYDRSKSLKGFAFPSNARHSMSYLLVVHPISTAFTSVQLVLTFLLFFHSKFSSSRYYTFLQLWSLPAFLLALLSFLTDLLMFIPHLTWCGWVLLVAASFIAVNGTLLCVLRRTAHSRFAREYTKNLSGNEIDLSAVDLVPLDDGHYDIQSSDLESFISNESAVSNFSRHSPTRFMDTPSAAGTSEEILPDRRNESSPERPAVTANQQLGAISTALIRSRLENPAHEIITRD